MAILQQLEVECLEEKAVYGMGITFINSELGGSGKNSWGK